MRPRTDHRPTEAQARALEALRTARSVLLVGHERPDGDVLGSQGALARALASVGVRATILNADPPERRFDYLAREVEYGAYHGGALPEHGLAVLLDANDIARAGALAAPLAAAPSRKLVVDHHLPSGEPWWDEGVVDPTASSTGVLVFRVAAWLGAELDAVGATALFTSLVSDTGWFRYSNADAETFRAAAALLDAGVQPHAVHAALHQRRDPEQPRVLAHLLERLEYHAGGRLALVALPANPGVRTDLADGDVLMDLLRAVEPVEVVLFLRELPDGRVKLSARAKGDADVHGLCARLGGGGHAKASGATLTAPLAAARERVLATALEELPEAAA